MIYYVNEYNLLYTLKWRNIMTTKFKSTSVHDLAVSYKTSVAIMHMTDICGPHKLYIKHPELLNFKYSNHVFNTLSTSLGILSYGTEVTVLIDSDNRLSCYCLSLPEIGFQELTANSKSSQSSPGHAIILSPYDIQSLSISSECRVLHVALPISSVQQSLTEILRRSVDKPLIFEPSMDAINGTSGSWWRMVKYLLDECNYNFNLYNQLVFSRDIENSLIKGLILSQPNNYSAEIQSIFTSAPPPFLLNAKRYICANAKKNIYLEDIRCAAGVSRIKLFEGFKNHFGCSPMAYLRKYRLIMIRQDILIKKTNVNIASIAFEWRMNHLGRFSRDYQKLFGEYPRDTIKRSHKFTT